MNGMKEGKYMKKIGIALLVMLVMVTGCAKKENTQITIVTREEGSGTRDAFVELTGVMVKDDQGNKVDRTSKNAVTMSSTQGVMSNIAGNEMAIGYISLGSLNESVKAVQVNGVEANAQNVKDGSYVLSRPFNVATKEMVSEVTQDFMNYMMSAEGQKVIEANGYISVTSGDAFVSTRASGKIVISGSSSISPVMEKLQEAYLNINPNATIELLTTDSSSGMNDAKTGKCDIGMASRALKDSEKETLQSMTIAMDGIAVIVNQNNAVNNLSLDEIREIFTGNTTTFGN